jgi:hypothetical protein
VDPWPFADAALRVRTEGRLLDGRFDSEQAMHAALRDARWAGLEVELVPGAGRGASA